MPQEARRRESRVDLRPFRLLFVLVLFALPAIGLSQTVTDFTPQRLIDPLGVETPLCLSDAYTLCLNGDRFSVTASYQLTPSGPSILAYAVRLTGDAGYFWFFDPNNVELVVKVLNGCGDPFNSYWVFAAGLTNLGVDLTVKDLRSGETRDYTNPLGTPFAPIQDTNAFRTCP
jgi:hypothetical protein